MDPAGGGDSTTIQGCIDLVDSGQSIIALAGNYVENIDFSGKNIALSSWQRADLTTIDGDGRDSTVVVDSGEGAGTLIQGFTITGGKNTDGGGVHVDGATLTIRDCIIEQNQATTGGYGGGVFASGATFVVQDSVISYNEADSAAGMMVRDSSPATISGVAFLHNTSSYSAANGGGLYLYHTTTTVDGCTFQDNAATNGAALAVALDAGHSVWVTSSAIGGNGLTSGSDSAVWLYGGSAGQVTLRSLIIADNLTRIAVEVEDGDALLENISLVGNHILLNDEGTVTVLNSIIFDNDGWSGQLVLRGGDTPSFQYDLISANTGSFDAMDDPVGSNGNIDDDPLFSAYYEDGDPTNDDLELQSTSPAIDAGKSSATYNDVDGSRNDMGAFGGPDGDWTPIWY